VLGFVNRTISDENMAGVVQMHLRTYLEEDRFSPNHNVFGGTFYNTAQYKGFSLYTEVTLEV
jgi:hypothetical protein